LPKLFEKLLEPLLFKTFNPILINPADSEFSSRDKLGIVSLSQKRQYLDVSFVYNLLNNNIEDAILLETILKINVPTFNSRNYDLFYLSHHTQNYNYYEPINKMLMNCNEVNNFDFFFDNMYKLKRITIFIIESSSCKR
jgi:hypothetical protein